MKSSCSYGVKNVRMNTDSYHDHSKVEKLGRGLDQERNKITQHAAKG